MLLILRLYASKDLIGWPVKAQHILQRPWERFFVNTSMNSLLLILFCFVSCVISLGLSGVSDDQIRSCLLGALKRFHEKSPPLKVSSPSSVQTSTPNLFERIPLDIKIDIFEKFLDYDSFITFKQTNSHYAQIPDEFIFRRLAKFNPYYLVEDAIVNKLLFAVISKHFVKSKNLQSPHIYDELQLLILKFTVEKLNFEVIPKQIYFCLIAFINETVHGLIPGVPLKKVNVLEDFATLLRQHDMPESLQFFKDNRELFENQENLGPDVEVHLDYLHSKPTREQIRDRFAFDPSNVDFWMNSSNATWLTYSLIELFADEISYDQLVGLSLRIISKKPILKNLLSLPDNQELIKELISRRNDFNDAADFCFICKETFKVDWPQLYFLTRETNFALLEFPSDSFHHLNIFRLDLLMVMLRNNLVIQEIALRILHHTSHLSDLISL
jgi:hypothetical protein